MNKQIQKGLDLLEKQYYGNIEKKRQRYRKKAFRTEHYMWKGEKRERLYIPSKKKGQIIQAYKDENGKWRRVPDWRKDELRNAPKAEIICNYVTFNNSWVNYHLLVKLLVTGKEVKIN